MYLYNYISLTVLILLALLSGLFKSKKAFIAVNLIVVGLLFANYSIILYLEHTYSFENIKGQDFETLYVNAEWLFNKLIYNFIGVLIFFVANTLVVYNKLWKFSKKNVTSNS
jgi:hypothetical protein